MNKLIKNINNFKTKSQIKSRIESVYKIEKNICSVSLLAMYYYEYESDEMAIRILKDYYNETFELNNGDLLVLATNLMYINEKYDDKECNNIIESIFNNTDIKICCNDNVFFAKGIFEYNHGNIEEAELNFRRAYQIKNRINYLYCELICKIHRGDSKTIFLNMEHNKELIINSRMYLDFLLMYGLESEILSKKYNKEWLKLEIEKIIKDIEVDEDLLAKLYYLMGEYEKCIEVYENSYFDYDEDWLIIYFFAVRKGRDKVKLKEKFKEIMYNIKEQVNEIKKIYGEDDEFYIEEEEKIAKIKKTYEMVISIDSMKNIREYIHYELKRTCYYIGCFKHMNFFDE